MLTATSHALKGVVKVLEQAGDAKLNGFIKLQQQVAREGFKSARYDTARTAIPSCAAEPCALHLCRSRLLCDMPNTPFAKPLAGGSSSTQPLKVMRL